MDKKTTRSWVCVTNTGDTSSPSLFRSPIMPHERRIPADAQSARSADKEAESSAHGSSVHQARSRRLLPGRS